LSPLSLDSGLSRWLSFSTANSFRASLLSRRRNIIVVIFFFHEVPSWRREMSLSDNVAGLRQRGGLFLEEMIFIDGSVLACSEFRCFNLVFLFYKKKFSLIVIGCLLYHKTFSLS
jgi:hypothetical protein